MGTVGVAKEAEAASKAEKDEEAAAATVVAAGMAEDDVAAGAAKEDPEASATSSCLDATVPDSAKGRKESSPIASSLGLPMSVLAMTVGAGESSLSSSQGLCQW